MMTRLQCLHHLIKNTLSTKQAIAFTVVYFRVITVHYLRYKRSEALLPECLLEVILEGNTISDSYHLF